LRTASIGKEIMTRLGHDPRQGAGWFARALFGGAVGLLLLGAGAPSLAQQAPSASAQLGRGNVGDAVQVDMSLLNTAAGAAKLSPPHPRGSLTPDQYGVAKALAARAAKAPGGEVGAAPAGSVEETPGASKVFLGQSESGSTPSDMALAVSNNWVVQVVNTSIAVYGRGGVLQAGFPKSLGSFFAGSTGDVGDPRAFFDWNQNRFVVVADDFTGGRIWLAASATDDPRGSWHVYSFNVWDSAANCRASGHSCADFPMLGFDDRDADATIYISLNFFPAAGGWSDYVLLLPKAKIYNGAGFGFNFWFNLSFNGRLQDSVQPMNLLTGNEHPRAGFAIDAHDNFFNGQCSTSACNGIVVWAFSNNLQATGSPGAELTAVIVPTANNYTLPALANQPGHANSVDTGDPRISATPSYHAGTITGALNTAGSDARYHVLWFQTQPTLNDNDARCTGSFLNKCPQITGARMVNEDCFFCGGQGASGGSYYGSLAPDIGGDLTMEYTFSDNSTFPESAYVSRRVTQAQNTMHDPGIVMCGGGSTAYLQGRWGDYSAAAGDITLPGLDNQWFSGMNDSAGNWATCIGYNGFKTVNQP
jgi:hypothetical protein